MSAPSLLSSFQRLKRPRILVVGDLILDRYTWGNAERVSQEAPVILLRADHCEDRLGGAANVCQMLRGLEAEVACAGIVGQDLAGDALKRLLKESGVETTWVIDDPSRPTTVKERFIGRAQGRHPHQILRVDKEVRDPLSPALEQDLARRLALVATDYDAILISDYAKGVCSAGMLQPLIAAALRTSVPVLVDPIRLSAGQENYYDRYHGATTMTPNRLEAELATGCKIRSPQDAYAAGEILRRKYQLPFAVITLDSDGMALVDAQGQGAHFPTRKREVYDITGAGDMVLAMLGLGMASGLEPAECIRLANVAGGLEVEKVGVAIIPRAEILAEIRESEKQSAAKGASAEAILAASSRQMSFLEKICTLEEATWRAQKIRDAGKKVVFTNGCFDLLHVGHVTYLREAAAMGDYLIVGVNSDAGIRRLKGPQRPIIKEADRAAMLAALGWVDAVIIFEEETPHRLLHALHPDLLVKGGTYTPEQVVGHEVVTAYGGKVCVAGVIEGLSTTAIVRSLQEKNASAQLQGPHYPLTESDSPTANAPANRTRNTEIGGTA